MILPTQTTQYYKGNASKSACFHCVRWDLKVSCMKRVRETLQKISPISWWTSSVSRWCLPRCALKDHFGPRDKWCSICTRTHMHLHLAPNQHPQCNGLGCDHPWGLTRLCGEVVLFFTTCPDIAQCWLAELSPQACTHSGVSGEIRLRYPSNQLSPYGFQATPRNAAQSKVARPYQQCKHHPQFRSAVPR